MVHTITTKDGIILKGTLFTPKQVPKALVQINPGTATKTSFYIPYAKFLVENGYSVFLWNYRGFCESRDGQSLAKKDYRFSDIGRFDIPAVTGYLKDLYPKLPLYVVGHSAGGQQIGLSENNHLIDGLVAIAVSVGYYGFMPWHYRVQAYFFFYLFGPLATLLTGYVPAKRFGFMEDLPRKIVREWGEWCARRDFLFDGKFRGRTIPTGNYEALPFPVEVFTATDDTISNRRSVPVFWDHVKSQKGIRFHWYDPKDLGRKEIGHFGYFRQENKDPIWTETLEALEGFK